MTSNIDITLWNEAAKNIDWIQPPTTVIEKKAKGPNPFVWFPGGVLNTCYNAVDRHCINRPHQPALIWDSAMVPAKKVLTYSQLLDEVQTLAGVLVSHDVKKGDTVLIYMPMVPEAIVAFLACARLGAVHSAVFGGFAPKELAKRIDDCRPKVVITASCGIEPKGIIPYKPLLESAINIASYKVPIRLLLQRPTKLTAPINHIDGDRDYQSEMDRIRKEGKQVLACTAVASEDPLYVLYTSGTTGVPKGICRTNGGHAVALRWSMDYVFNVKAGECMFTASDIGWAVSHSYTVYGPFLAGATSVMYEGKPVQTPDAGTFWRLLSDYNVKVMFTAPTAIRAMRREDPHGDLAKKYSLTKLKAVFVAGERSDIETLNWCQEIVGPDCYVIDNYWQTETGFPMTSTCLGTGKKEKVKFGSAGKQVPGSIIKILDEDSNEEITEPNRFGNIVLKLPLPPASFPYLWNNRDSYETSYFAKYPGYYDTGDAGMIDEEGYIHVMSRTDDIINVAGHRLSTGSVEQIIMSHPKVVECCVVPLPDPMKMKGHVPMGVIVLQQDHAHCTQEEFNKTILPELIKATRNDLGAIACFDTAVIVSRLPKTRSGKVLRRCIRDMVDGKEVRIPGTIEDASVLLEIENILYKNKLIPYRSLSGDSKL
ncbi:uncharacterized protein BX664DRAFT_272334 [Halteromyces radiatus]|uniref:uncharacterized protein n=1 Tax=Halteromyces radiatus TaxID=101107 RepID=UPI00221E60F7|nr:uncharacterized protein BX664DRAFT_272334 [Halteromyces radiatus]KAI8099219.1 hypothetical protein BX664DRAFT_272334 [Halteromyces radiatus]